VITNPANPPIYNELDFFFFESYVTKVAVRKRVSHFLCCLLCLFEQCRLLQMERGASRSRRSRSSSRVSLCFISRASRDLPVYQVKEAQHWVRYSFKSGYKYLTTLQHSMWQLFYSMKHSTTTHPPCCMNNGFHTRNITNKIDGY